MHCLLLLLDHALIVDVAYDRVFKVILCLDNNFSVLMLIDRIAAKDELCAVSNPFKMSAIRRNRKAVVKILKNRRAVRLMTIEYRLISKVFFSSLR